MSTIFWPAIFLAAFYFVYTVLGTQRYFLKLLRQHNKFPLLYDHPQLDWGVFVLNMAANTIKGFGLGIIIGLIVWAVMPWII